MFKILLVAAICAGFMRMNATPSNEKVYNDRVYIDESEMEVKNGIIHVHEGHNIWVRYKSATIDSTGLYTHERDLVKDCHNIMERSWKCPYCHRHWPLKTSCQNEDCPSRYM